MAGNLKKIHLLYLKKEKIRKDVPGERFAVSRASFGFWLPARVSCNHQTSLDTRTSELLQVLPSMAKNNRSEPCILLKAKLV